MTSKLQELQDYLFKEGDGGGGFSGGTAATVDSSGFSATYSDDGRPRGSHAKKRKKAPEGSHIEFTLALVDYVRKTMWPQESGLDQNETGNKSAAYVTENIADIGPSREDHYIVTQDDKSKDQEYVDTLSGPDHEGAVYRPAEGNQTENWDGEMKALPGYQNVGDHNVDGLAWVDNSDVDETGRMNDEREKPYQSVEEEHDTTDKRRANNDRPKSFAETLQKAMTPNPEWARTISDWNESSGFRAAGGHHGMSEDEYRSAAQKKLNDLTTNADVKMRVPAHKALSTLISQYKPQPYQYRDSRESSDEDYDITDYQDNPRAVAEEQMFNIPRTESRESERPTYGYMHNGKEGYHPQPVDMFGSVKFTMKPHVKSHSTFVEGDSHSALDPDFPDSLVYPSPINNPSLHSVQHARWDTDPDEELDSVDYEEGNWPQDPNAYRDQNREIGLYNSRRSTPFLDKYGLQDTMHYTEAHMHKPLKTSDVAHIEVPAQMPDHHKQALKDAIEMNGGSYSEYNAHPETLAADLHSASRYSTPEELTSFWGQGKHAEIASHIPKPEANIFGESPKPFPHPTMEPGATSTLTTNAPSIKSFDFIRKAEDINLSTKVIIRDENGRVLILEDAYSDFWDLPGGHIHDEEGPAEGAKRETFEEVGFKLDQITEFQSKDMNLGGEQRVVLFYLAWVKANAPIPHLSEEHTGFHWASLDDLIRFNLGVFKPIIAYAMRFVFNDTHYEDNPYVEDKNRSHAYDTARQVLGKFHTIEEHGDGDLTVLSNNKQYVITTDGGVFEQMPLGHFAKMSPVSYSAVMKEEVDGTNGFTYMWDLGQNKEQLAEVEPPYKKANPEEIADPTLPNVGQADRPERALRKDAMETGIQAPSNTSGSVPQAPKPPKMTLWPGMEDTINNPNARKTGTHKDFTTALNNAHNVKQQWAGHLTGDPNHTDHIDHRQVNWYHGKHADGSQLHPILHNFAGGWSLSSESNEGNALKVIASKYFGHHEPTARANMGDAYENGEFHMNEAMDPEHVKQLHDAFHQNYTKGQEWLKQKGITKPIKVYRGVHTGGGVPVEPGQDVTTQDHSLSSWTVDPEQARGFGDVVLEREVHPRDIVFGMHDLLGADEHELVLHTPPQGADARVMHVAEPRWPTTNEDYWSKNPEWAMDLAPKQQAAHAPQNMGGM